MVCFCVFSLPLSTPWLFLSFGCSLLTLSSSFLLSPSLYFYLFTFHISVFSLFSAFLPLLFLSPSLAPLFPTAPSPGCGCRKLADCPELLDVEDMVQMREPDWKCVYTYLQEFYRGLVTKGLVKTKNSS